MYKKSFALGMVIPFAATGAIAMASPASAVPPKPPKADRSSVTCHLNAVKHVKNISLVLHVNSTGRQGDHFVVTITHNRQQILHQRKFDKDGDFTLRDWARDKRGDDHFRAVVKNVKTGDRDVCFDVVKDRKPKPKAR